MLSDPGFVFVFVGANFGRGGAIVSGWVLGVAIGGRGRRRARSAFFGIGGGFLAVIFCGYMDYTLDRSKTGQPKVTDWIDTALRGSSA